MTRTRYWGIAVASGACVMLLSSLVLAQEEKKEEEGRYPLSFVERPLTLPPLVLAPGLDADILHVSLSGGGLGGTDTVLGIGAGAKIGIIENLEARATVLTLAIDFSPPPGTKAFQYAGFSVGATYRFLKGPLEMGAAFDAFIQTADPSGALLKPGVPILVHLGKVARLDTGVTVPISTFGGGSSPLPGIPAASPSTTVGLGIPARLAFDIIEPLHVGVLSGLSIGALNPPAGESVTDTMAVPLGFFGGYAIGGRNGPILDIDPTFVWPAFLLPGAGGSASVVQAGVFDVAIEFTGYLYL